MGYTTIFSTWVGNPPEETCVMKKIAPFLLALLLIACGQSEAPQEFADSVANIQTVEELAASPERLKELRQQCKTDHPQAAATCWATGWMRPRASDSTGTVPLSTHRRKNHPSSDYWWFATSLSFFA